VCHAGLGEQSGDRGEKSRQHSPHKPRHEKSI
jgi:hypothetical protein